MDKKGKRQKNLSLAFLILIGAACGFFFGKSFGVMVQGKTAAEQLTEWTFCFFGVLVAICVQIVVHEAGHLICGILTGYTFSSFRIGSLMWVKENGKVVFKKLSLAGMAGQCLMVPPDLVDGKYPFKLYHLGGVLLNIGSGLLCLGLAAICRNARYPSALLLFVSVVGFASALMNGVPMCLGTVDNDGYNVLSIGANDEAARACWMQLKMNERVARGIRMKDMPREWFYMPSADAMNNSMTAVMGVVYCNRLMDMHLFAEAQQRLDELLQMDSAIVGLHGNLLNCDRIYCELMGENRQDRVDAMLDKGLKRFMKSMRNFPTVLRTEYVYAVLAEHDPEKAETIKNRFEMRVQTYPYQGDVESERELMNLAEQLARQRAQASNP